MINPHCSSLIEFFRACCLGQTINSDPNSNAIPLRSPHGHIDHLISFHKLQHFFSNNLLSLSLLEDRFRQAFRVMDHLIALSKDRDICEPVFLKGPLLAARLYRKPHLRLFQDLDILYPASQRAKVFSSYSQNYVRTEYSMSKEVWIPKESTNHSIFNYPIEIHYGLPITIASSPSSYVVFGHRYLHLSSSDEIHYLMHHAWIQHRFQHLIWCLDIDLYLHKTKMQTPNKLDPNLYSNAESLFTVIRGERKMDSLSRLEKHLIHWILLGQTESNPIKIAILRSWLMGGYKPFLKYRLNKGFSHFDYDGGTLQ